MERGDLPLDRSPRKSDKLVQIECTNEFSDLEDLHEQEAVTSDQGVEVRPEL